MSDNIYSSCVEPIFDYMYPKQYKTLNVSVTETVSGNTSAEATTEPVVEESPMISTSDVASLKKADLVNLIKETFGPDSNVTGTKAELLARFFS